MNGNQKINSREYLESHGIRPSVQRLAVMDYLLINKTHPTVEEIFSALYPVIPTLSRTTVYNTLRLLADKRAILALELDPRQTHFDGDTTPHAHFICSKCGAIEDVFLDVMTLQYITGEAEAQSIEITYRGVCRKCRSAN